MHLTIWYIVLVCHQGYVSENYIGSVYVGGFCGLCSELCPVGLLGVCKCFFLQSLVVSYVDYGDDW